MSEPKTSDPVTLLEKIVSGIKDESLLAVLFIVLVAALVVGFGTSGDLRVGLFVIVAVVGLLVVIALRLAQFHQRRADESAKENGQRSVRDEIEPAVVADIVDLLDHTRLQVASAIQVPLDHVRANVFAYAGGVLRMVPEFTSNMTYEKEFALAFRPGEGSTGRCYKNKDVNVATFQGDWGPSGLAPSKMANVNPNLRWIVSMPVYSRRDDRSTVIWVLNCDGLEDVCDENRLQPVIALMYLPASLLTYVVVNSGLGSK